MRTAKKVLSMLLAMSLICGFTACSAKETGGSTPAEKQPTAETEKTEGPKPVLLAVSFGSSYNETRDLTIGAVEKALQEANPDYEVRRAFTSQTIIDILKEREKLEIDNVTEAMGRLIRDGVTDVVIQPTHVMPGLEYDDVIAEITPYAAQFNSFKVGNPLLTEDADYQALIASLVEETAEYNKEGTALVFMGHGTHHEANATYTTLQQKLKEAGHSNYFIGTVEAEPSLEDVLALVKESNAKKVVLLPLMIVAGDHATNDMAGDEEDSWKTAFKNAGYEVECVLKGLGQYKGVQEMIVDHAAKADTASFTAQSEKEDVQKPVLLAVSFGSSYNETRDLTIGAVEKALQEANPDYEVRRAFTSQTIIDILKEREKLEIDNVTEAMGRLIRDGVTEVLVQPTHVMPGLEYDDIIAEIAPYAPQFKSLKVGKPLLTTDDDYYALITSLTEETEQYNKEDTALVFMGHGTHHEANATYAELQNKLDITGHTNYFVGTVEAEPSLEDVLALVKESNAKKVVLLPLMIVAGDHATNDMAGDEEDSWKTAFKNAGYEVECVLKGLGQYKGVQKMIVDHAAKATSMAEPLSANELKEGTYEITVRSSSSMFNVVNCQLTVADGKMTAAMTMSGDGYGKLFAGTGEQAAAAPEAQHIPAEKDSKGAVVFQFPVEQLNVDTDCAAWSLRKEKWYDRTLVFESDALPSEALNK